MVAVTPQLLFPLGIFIMIFFIVVFAFLKRFSIPHRNWFVFGMFVGTLIYFVMAWGSTFKESITTQDFFLKLSMLILGSTYYVTAVFFSTMISLMILLKKETKERISTLLHGKEKNVIYFITGLSLIFGICDIYLAFRCVETIPFLENIISQSACS